MTTKFKIILGFTVMILLLGGMAASGYLDLEKASEGFTSYRRQARVNVASSDMVSSMNDSLLKIFTFMRRPESVHFEAAMKSADEFHAIAKTAEEETHIAYRQEAFQNMQKQVPGFKNALQVLHDSQLSLQKQYDEVVRPSYNAMVKQIHDLSEAAVRLQNYDCMYSLTLILEDFAQCLSALGRFSQSVSREDAKTAHDRVLALETPLKRLPNQLISEGGRKIYADLYAGYQTMTAAVGDMLKSAEVLRANVITLGKYEEDITAAITALSGRIDTEMRAEGQAVLDSNAQAQRLMMIVSVAGVLIGAALAAITIVGIIRVLNDMAGFAKAIAEGNFEHQVRTREKGEIGVMVASMQQIPATLKSVLEEYTMLEHAIENGKLTIQGNADNFRGGFATIIRGTNAILNRFLTVIENIPSPVVMLDRDRKAAYINTIARKLAGEGYQGKTCFELFARDDFGSEQDALRKAVETKAPASAETRAHPQGRAMDVSYTAIPMLSEKGEITSIMQLITDLTAIKSQQRTMMDVAHQASEISNRVAAASEQLSAQVEQVSRGAEMQRDRVESTASAMTEMNSTVLEVARSAGEASEQSEKTREKANDGATLVNRVVQAMNQVNAVTITLQGNMQELGGQAESIGGVMNVISDIADQTNLLALNAAIEAARAGEAGRGFAVVADEVRKLAEKTMEATHEVGSSITAIQNSARTNIEEVGNAVKNINDATELANSSGEALKEIVDLASSNSAVVASIATAAEEQSATSEEINRAIEEINQVVGETTEGMIQSSAAVQELSQMAQELRHVMDGLK